MKFQNLAKHMLTNKLYEKSNTPRTLRKNQCVRKAKMGLSLGTIDKCPTYNSDNLITSICLNILANESLNSIMKVPNSHMQIFLNFLADVFRGITLTALTTCSLRRTLHRHRAS